MKETKNTTWNLRLQSKAYLIREIKFIFADAKKNHLPHNEISQFLFDAVYSNSRYKTLPNYMKEGIKGYIEANYDIMWEYVEWVHWYKGEYMGKNLPYSENFDQNEVISEHVYKFSKDVY